MNEETNREYLPDRLFLSDELVAWIAENLPTPLYVYDAAGIRETAERMKAAFAWNSGYRQFFPAKVLCTRAILRLMLEIGVGLLCTTALELEAAFRAGASTEQILFVPCFARDEDIRAALQYNLTTVIDSRCVLERFLALGSLPERIGLRFAPGKRIEIGAHVLARAENFKYGMNAREIFFTAKRLEEYGVKEIGLHIHMGGNQGLEAYWGRLVGLLIENWKHIESRTELRLSFLDIGGGLGVPGESKDRMPDIAKVSESVRQQMEKDGVFDVPIYTEFGRYLTGPHGLYLARTLYYKDSCMPRPVIAVDGSTTQVLRTLTNNTYYPISVAGRREIPNRKVCSVAGYQSEKRDLLGTQRILPVPSRGELVAVHNTGAYAASRQNEFWGDVPCAEYLLEDGKLRLIRRAADPETAFLRDVDEE